MKTNIKYFGKSVFSSAFVILALILGVFSSIPTSANADFILTQSCVNLTNNMRYGATDYYTNGDVSRLQNFLTSRGYMSIRPTGYFGSITHSAVQRFQSANGLYSAGYVGPYTRAKIQEISCGGVVPPIVPPVVTTAPIINSISPTQGPIGTLVTINGVNFNSSSKVLFDSSPISTYSNNGNQITFVVPASINPSCYYSNPPCLAATRAIVPGSYSVAVQNNDQYGIRNSGTFTFYVTSGGTGGGNQQPVINGLDAPTQLSVGQTGTWTVRASDVTGGGLNYSVVWGDESYFNVGDPYSAMTQYQGQSSTFSHVYYSAGTFTPTFTVRGSNGLTAKTSATVRVGQVNNDNYVPVITNIYPGAGYVGTYVTLYGTGMSSTDTVLFGGGPVSGVTSYGGSITFRVPDSIAPDCQPGMFCALYMRVVTPGIYDVKVRNNYGTSNTVSFRVY